MPSVAIAALGAIAGLTIFFGLPFGRLKSKGVRLKAALNAIAIGILIFLLWDVLSQAWEPVDAALHAHLIGTALVNGVLMMACMGLGLLGLVYTDRRMRGRIVATRPAEAPVPAPVGGSGVSTATLTAVAPVFGTVTDARRLALTIAIGIGLHNFAEGLAIGASAAQGQLAFAVLLVIGFGLHNMTEGFGIVAPLAGTRPSWRYLALLGLIGGAPTFVGTIVGQAFTNDLMSVAFLGLASGSILYVVIELLAVSRRVGTPHLTAWFILAGITAGFLTDAIVTAAGA